MCRQQKQHRIKRPRKRTLTASATQQSQSQSERLSQKACAKAAPSAVVSASASARTRRQSNRLLCTCSLLLAQLTELKLKLKMRLAAWDVRIVWIRLLLLVRLTRFLKLRGYYRSHLLSRWTTILVSLPTAFRSFVSLLFSLSSDEQVEPTCLLLCLFASRILLAAFVYFRCGQFIALLHQRLKFFTFLISYSRFFGLLSFGLYAFCFTYRTILQPHPNRNRTNGSVWFLESVENNCTLKIGWVFFQNHFQFLFSWFCAFSDFSLFWIIFLRLSAFSGRQLLL